MSKKSKAFKSVDTLSKELDIVDNFVLKYWKKYVMAAVIVLIAIATFLIFSKKSCNNGTTTSNEILAASTVKQLEDVVKKYPKCQLAQYARLRLASMLINTKDYTGATSVYNEIISNDCNSFATHTAKLNMAYLAEKENKTDEAVKMFLQLADDSSLPVSIRGEAEYSAGIMYFKQGNKALALKYLQRCANAEKKACLGWPEMAQSLLNRMN